MKFGRNRTVLSRLCRDGKKMQAFETTPYFELRSCAMRMRDDRRVVAHDVVDGPWVPTVSTVYRQYACRVRSPVRAAGCVTTPPTPSGSRLGGDVCGLLVLIFIHSSIWSEGRPIWRLGGPGGGRAARSPEGRFHHLLYRAPVPTGVCSFVGVRFC